MNQPNLQKGGDAVMRDKTSPLVDSMTSPEPAQAEVGANDSNVEAVRFDQIVKKYRLEFSANRIDESWSDGFERYCLLAIQEATATLRAELAEAKRHLADARFAHSVERIQFDKEKPFFYKDAPETQAYCPECGSSHIDLTDPPASPEPAQAEAKAEFKPTTLEQKWGMIFGRVTLRQAIDDAIAANRE